MIAVSSRGNVLALNRAIVRTYVEVGCFLFLVTVCVVMSMPGLGSFNRAMEMAAFGAVGMSHMDNYTSLFMLVNVESTDRVLCDGEQLHQCPSFEVALEPRERSADVVLDGAAQSASSSAPFSGGQTHRLNIC